MIKKYFNAFNILVILIILALDQITKLLIIKNFELGEIKPIISNFLVLQFIENYGMAFGIGTNIFPLAYQKYLFILFMLIAIAVVIYFYSKIEKNAYMEKLAFGFILGGAFGNLFDKVFGYIIFYQKFDLFYGRVVDFIQFKFANYTGPTFNLADIFISTGIILLFFSSYKNHKK